MQNHRTQRVESAKAIAIGLGHGVALTGFRYGLALVACEHCDRTGDANLDPAFPGYVNGAIFAFPCREGGAALIPPAPTSPAPTSKAKPAPSTVSKPRVEFDAMLASFVGAKR